MSTVDFLFYFLFKLIIQSTDFIDYIKTKYSLVMFKSDDFSLLRRILHDYYPAEKIYF